MAGQKGGGVQRIGNRIVQNAMCIFFIFKVNNTTLYTKIFMLKIENDAFAKFLRFELANSSHRLSRNLHLYCSAQ